MIIKKEQFIWDFCKNGNGKISSFIQSVNFKAYNIINKEVNPASQLFKVFYLSLFPGYLDSKLVKSKAYNFKKITHHGFGGAGIDLEGTNSVESYLKANKKKKLWTNIKRGKKKLEETYLIDYEYNYGSISDEKCAFILDTLKEMISKRFGMEALRHSFIMDWENNILDMADSIRQEKTSLLVIYSDHKPVSISVNRHVAGTIFFCDTHGFDLNYSEYGLGNINNYMRLNLCFKNKIPFLDLGNGVSDFKKIWCNSFYETYYLIYFKKHDFIATVIAYFEITKIRLKNFIKSCVYNIHHKKILNKK